MKLSKEDTKMIQGLSVLAMVCLHLFDRTDYQGLYQPLLFIKGIPLSFYFGQLSDFCVFGFAFCSGYAHMLLYRKENYYKKRLKGLLPLVVNYWIVIAIFSIISIMVKQGEYMPGSFGTLFGNLFLYNVTYKGAWWYMWAYIILVLISPLILKVVDSTHSLFSVIAGFVIYCLAYYVRFHTDSTNYLLVRFGPFGMTLFEYMIGAIVFKLDLYSKVKRILEKISKYLFYIGSVFLLAAMLFVRTLVVRSLFVAPITGMLIIVIFVMWEKPNWVQQVFLYLGKHSTNIWLTHMFFYLVLFKDFIYYFRYPALIFIAMITITLMVSELINRILNLIIIQKQSEEQTKQKI